VKVWVANLSANFERIWMRPPSSVELDGLIAEWVNEEMLYREALALGFDRDDSVIRRRMRQEMEFLYADVAVAHSLTLAAATLGWLDVPAAPVEAAIALSIVFVAAEVLRGGDGLATRKPWLVAFSFGLLHGLGFAGALSEDGLPSHAIPVALAFFHIAVEVGQLLFIIATVLAVFKLVSAAPRLRADGETAGVWSVTAVSKDPVSYSIGILGSFWLIDRMASFWESREGSRVL
jgi:hypothetical protein